MILSSAGDAATLQGIVKDLRPAYRRGKLEGREARLERDDFSSDRHPALAYLRTMIFSENRYPLFGIML